MKALRIPSVILHFFIGIGAVAGGWAAITNPETPLGMPAEALKAGPFKDFLIPGLILFFVIGLGNIISGIAALKRINHYEYCSGIMGVLLAGWILVQCILLRSVAALHGIYFSLGVVQGIISIIELWIMKKFPMDMVQNFFKRNSR